MPNGNQPIRSLDSGTVGQVPVTGPDTYVRWQDPPAYFAPARCVVTANIATLGGAGSFAGVAGGSTTNSDGVTCVAGDIVLLVSQTTAAQNGPYVVGTVAAGTAPLTRPVWWFTGSTLPATAVVSVSGEGTIYKNTLWKCFLSALNFVVDTTDPKLYPPTVTFTCALVAGALTAGVGATAGAPANLPVFSANSYLLCTRKTANTCTLTANGYAVNAAATPGVPGTGAATLMGCVAAGTINVADVSTMICTLVNQI